MATGNIETLRDMFEYELEQMYYIENELVEELEAMATTVDNETMQTAFADHREETERHVQRLEDAFDALGREPEMRECEALQGLVADKREFDSMVGDDDLRDLYYLGAGVKVEHFETAGYQGLLTVAEKLDLSDDVTGPLEENLDSEQNTLKQLKAMSEGSELKSMLERLLG